MPRRWGLRLTTRGARPLSQPLIPPVWVFRAPLDAKGRGALGAPPAVGLAAQPAARAKGPASGPTLPCRRGRGHSVLRTKTSSTQILRSYLQAEARRRGVRRPGRGSWGVRMASWGVGVRMASACGCASVATRGHASDGMHVHRMARMRSLWTRAPVPARLEDRLESRQDAARRGAPGEGEGQWSGSGLALGLGVVLRVAEHQKLFSIVKALTHLVRVRVRIRVRVRVGVRVGVRVRVRTRVKARIRVS